MATYKLFADVDARRTTCGICFRQFFNCNIICNDDDVDGDLEDDGLFMTHYIKASVFQNLKEQQ